MFQSIQPKFYQELDGKSHEENIIPGKEKSREFWSGIWEKDVKHNESADWIQKVAEEMQGNKQKTGMTIDLMVSIAIGARSFCQCRK